MARSNKPMNFSRGQKIRSNARLEICYIRSIVINYLNVQLNHFLHFYALTINIFVLLYIISLKPHFVIDFILQ